jgi:class 3 adenylate cyclase
MLSPTEQSTRPLNRFDALAEALSRSVPERMRTTEWAAGYGVFGVEFASGDVLALRRFPYGTLGAYSTVWHRSAEGVWRVYFDAPRPDLACPRYFSDALFDTERASIELDWQDPQTLEIRASRRHLVDLQWRLTLGSSARTSLLNTISRLMPSRLTSTPAVLNAMARGSNVLLGMGGFAATGHSPNGQHFMLRPRWMAPVASSSARLNGSDLGAMVNAPQTRALGDFIIPRRPLFAVGWTSFGTAPTMAAPIGEAIDVDEQGELLSKYVCQRLVSRVMQAAHGGTFGGERTFATVLFIDINGFTRLAERCEPERVMQILNRNLEVIVDTIFRYDGAVLKFLGDGVLAAFGVHQRRDDDVDRAAMAALEIQANLQAAQAFVAEDERVSVAIGLHCGDLVCGNIGHRDRLDFTIIGDTVNVAQRIQTLAQAGETLVSGDVARAITAGFVLGDEREASVKGRDEPVQVYRLIDSS